MAVVSGEVLTTADNVQHVKQGGGRGQLKIMHGNRMELELSRIFHTAVYLMQRSLNYFLSFILLTNIAGHPLSLSSATARFSRRLVPTPLPPFNFFSRCGISILFSLRATCKERNGGSSLVGLVQDRVW